MKDGTIFGLGFIVGLCLVAAVVLIITIVSIVKDGKAAKQYDERQTIVRGKAYQVMAITGAIYMVAAALIDLLGTKWAVTALQMLIGLLICVGAFITVCVIKDAYFALSEMSPRKKIRNLASFFLIGVCNLLSFIVNILDGETMIDENGLQMDSINLIIAVLFLYLSAVLIVKMIADKKTAEEE